ncbi:MAG: RDD family protein [Pirellulaceae bacterium]
MTDNPYASPAIDPTTVAHVASGPMELKIASQGKRFLNLVIDNIIIQVLSSVAGFALGVMYATAQIAENGSVESGSDGGLRLAGFVVGLLVSLAYFVITEALFQRTLAKFVTGTVVVTASGARPSFGQIVGRSLARFIPFEPFSFLGGKQPVGWHDSMSGTRVIATK